MKPQPFPPSAGHPRKMLRLLDQAEKLWDIPILGAERSGLLRRLIAAHQPRKVLEIGSLLGYSAIVIADAIGPHGRLTCVEVNRYLAKFVTNNIKRAGLVSRAKVVVQDAREPIAGARGKFDFVLIDAAKDQYLDYLKAVELRLSDGAVVVADNVGKFRREVAAYLAYVRKPGGSYQSHTCKFKDDAMEVSIFRAPGKVVTGR